MTAICMYMACMKIFVATNIKVDKTCPTLRYMTEDRNQPQKAPLMGDNGPLIFIWVDAENDKEFSLDRKLEWFDFIMQELRLSFQS